MSNKVMIQDLKEALDNELNVIIEGEHGVGKTHIVSKLFTEKYGEDSWAYFSAPTMDPFIDFIGCPKETVDENTGTKYLDVVRPKRFAEDKIEAIFMDEFNRGDTHVRNAVMELIQFKSLNGIKYDNLKVIWVAINPYNDDYDTDRLDLAQESRFHVRLNMPYQPDRNYFSNKYGQNAAAGAISWWNELKINRPDLIKKVSPRTLDYAMDGFLNKKMRLEPFLPQGVELNSLKAALKDGPVLEKLKECGEDHEKITKFFKDENNFSATKDYVLSQQNTEKYIHYWPKEKIAAEIVKVKHRDLLTSIISESVEVGNGQKMYDIIANIIAVGSENNKEFLEYAQSSSILEAIESYISMSEIKQI